MISEIPVTGQGDKQITKGVMSINETQLSFMTIDEVQKIQVEHLFKDLITPTRYINANNFQQIANNWKIALKAH